MSLSDDSLELSYSYQVKGQLLLDQKLQFLTRSSALCKLLFELCAAKFGDLWASFSAFLEFLVFLVAPAWDWSYKGYFHWMDHFLGSF